MHERMRNRAGGRKTAHERKIGLQRTARMADFTHFSIRALRVALGLEYDLPVP